MIRNFVKYFSLGISSSSILFGICVFLKRLSNFNNSFPSSLGLLTGLGCVISGQIIVLIYHYICKIIEKFDDSILIQNNKVCNNFEKNIIRHFRSREIFLLLFYLTFTWMFKLIPSTYYIMDNMKTNWEQVLQQLILVDFLMYTTHIAEHYFYNTSHNTSHNTHHTWTNPIIFNAFNASIKDVIVLIIFPLYITANLIHTNTWTYMAFGTIYSSYLMLIHSEYKHPWDNLFRWVGIGTGSDHHIHHLKFKWNFGHFFTWWDRLFNTYRHPSTVKEIRNGKSNFKEYISLIKYFTRSRKNNLICENNDIKYCNYILSKVSRSFSVVIQELPEELSLPVCIFYLVLRALDTIEDEMGLIKFKFECYDPLQNKVKILRRFFTILENNSILITKIETSNIGEKYEHELLKNIRIIIRVYHTLSLSNQKIIINICKKMGGGMAEYINKDLSQGTKTLAEYNNYCYIVAGLVGEGLSMQFYESKLENSDFLIEKGINTLSSQMGMFLQKTNIIRDYHEDLINGRAWWPEEIWSKFVPENDSAKLSIFLTKKSAGVACLNALICDALSHAVPSLNYLKMITNKDIFSFCAIPQVMAIMTLELLYSNPKVFRGKVKICKIIAIHGIVNSHNFSNVHKFFVKSVTNILNKTDNKQLIKYCRDIIYFH